MNIIRSTFLFFSLLLGFSAFLYADPEVRVMSESNEISLGSTLNLTIEAQWPTEEAHYLLGIPPLPLKNMSVLRQGESQETLLIEGTKWLKKTFTFELAGKEPGPASVDTFSINFTDSGTGRRGLIAQPETFFTVTPAKNKENPVLLIFFITFPIILIGSFIFIKIKAKRLREADKASAIKEEAELVDAITFENPRDDISNLSKLFMLFLDKTYDLAGAHLTDSAISEQLKGRDVPYAERETIQTFLTTLHEAQYMGTSTSKSELNLLRNQIVNFMKGKKGTDLPTIQT